MIRIGNLSKLASRGVALLTFGIGLLLSVWVSSGVSSDQNNLTAAAILTPARELTERPGEWPIWSDNLLIIQRFTEPPSIYQPVTAPEPANDFIEFGCGTLTVSIDSDGNIDLNSEGMSTVSDLRELRRRLVSLFQERIRKRAYQPGMLDRSDLPMSKRIYATVIISPSPTTTLDDLTSVIQLVKDAGANQVALRLTPLNHPFNGSLKTSLKISKH